MLWRYTQLFQVLANFYVHVLDFQLFINYFFYYMTVQRIFKIQCFVVPLWIHVEATSIL